MSDPRRAIDVGISILIVLVIIQGWVLQSLLVVGHRGVAAAAIRMQFVCHGHVPRGHADVAAGVPVDGGAGFVRTGSLVHRVARGQLRRQRLDVLVPDHAGILWSTAVNHAAWPGGWASLIALVMSVIQLLLYVLVYLFMRP